ncbi:dienelactone hydrolase family protein [Thioalkalivibrio sulfidiphilus]|uniref:dienelactone hydrolase family protein n=1 Tax=Thioalkalivibrio sulfidiphilus TaxID=1033854 RepID=UPI00035C5FC9|nr:dienelactone hydrolase family protein [Thioalkalivibrio sulfidiphilus]
MRVFAALVGAFALSLFTLSSAQAEVMHDWWDAAWWERGELVVPENHKVVVTRDSYDSGDVDVPVMIARPDDGKKYPAVLFVHGRRGLDDLIELHVKRLAARGFVVVAPDLYTGRFIEKFPIEHDYVLEKDLNHGLDFLLARDDLSSQQACAYSHTRGGYYSLKVAVTYERQGNGIACYVSYYPHMQDPNAPEPMQVYRYAPEADQLTIPVLVMLGEHEQYQRRRGAEMAISALRNRDRPAQLVVYPGVGRGFDFRDPAVRTFADDLATKDAIQRASRFMKEHLK